MSTKPKDLSQELAMIREEIKKSMRVMIVDLFVFIAVTLLLFFCVLVAAWC